MNVPTNIQVIKNTQGQPAFAVIPWENYMQLSEARPIDLANGVPEAVVSLVFDKHYTPIKAWRTHLKLTQEQVATRLDISQAAYSQHETNDNIRPATLAKIAKALGVTLEQLDF